MPVRFLLDEQISPKVAERARKLGLDVTAVSGSDLAGSGDGAVFRRAIDEGRIVVTYDIADFTVLYSDLLKEGASIPGLVFVDAGTISTADLSGLARALAKLAALIEKGEVDPSGGIFLRSAAD